MASSAGVVGRARQVGTRESLLLALLVVGLVAGTDLIDFGAYHLRYAILDASTASSWSHRLDAAVLVAGAGLCVMGASRARYRRGTWLALAAILAFLFVDEVSTLHTQIGHLGYGKLLYAPVLAAAVLAVWKLTAGTAFVVALPSALAVLSASYVIHVLGPGVVRALGWGPSSWAYQLKVGLKEGAELAGLLLALLVLSGAALDVDPQRLR